MRLLELISVKKYYLNLIFSVPSLEIFYRLISDSLESLSKTAASYKCREFTIYYDKKHYVNLNVDDFQTLEWSNLPHFSG